VFRGLRHLIRLLIDTVLDLWKIPAQSLEELDDLGDFLLAENCGLQRTNVAMNVEFIPCFWAARTSVTKNSENRFTAPNSHRNTGHRCPREQASS
jgi:hypothetical protein